MLSFSGVTLVLFCVVFVHFTFTEATALLPIFLRPSIYMRPDSHTQLPNNCLRPFSLLFLSFLCFFGDVAFSEYFYTITVLSFYGEYVVRFSLPGGVFLPCDHGLDFDISLCETSISQSIVYCFIQIPADLGYNNRFQKPPCPDDHIRVLFPLRVQHNPRHHHAYAKFHTEIRVK